MVTNSAGFKELPDGSWLTPFVYEDYHRERQILDADRVYSSPDLEWRYCHADTGFVYCLFVPRSF